MNLPNFIYHAIPHAEHIHFLFWRNEHIPVMPLLTKPYYLIILYHGFLITISS